MDGPWINGWSVHQYPLGCPSNANEPIARARAWTFWSLLSALGYVVTTVSLNTSDHFLPQNRERLWIMGYRDDLCGQASHAHVQEFLKAKTLSWLMATPPSVSTMCSYQNTIPQSQGLWNMPELRQ